MGKTMSFAEEKLNDGKGIAEPSKKSIKETIIEASKMIQRKRPVTGFISVAVTEDARKLFESWGYVEVSPNYWERKK